MNQLYVYIHPLPLELPFQPWFHVNPLDHYFILFMTKNSIVYLSIYLSRSTLLWDSLVAQIVKNLPAMQETWIWSLGQGRSPGEGNGNPLQYSCLGNPMDWSWGRKSWHDCVENSRRIHSWPRVWKWWVPTTLWGLPLGALLNSHGKYQRIPLSAFSRERKKEPFWNMPGHSS